ncbi:MAG: hypothetical protein K2K38_01025 [Clostridia bacterium]|nr:hypothetical protein [Clostridia bacterium]
MFGKKNKKTKEEIETERRARIEKVTKDLKLQVVTLTKKRDAAFAMVLEARQKGLEAQEKQARGLLKQTMAACKRAEGMLMTMELAVQSRDLAELNQNFLNSIGILSEDIISASRHTANIKQVENKYMHAMYETERQKENIDRMLSVGEYSAAASIGQDDYSEFDSEIDSMLDEAALFASATGDRTKLKN